MAAENGSVARAALLKSSKYPRLILFSAAFSVNRRSLSADLHRRSGNAESREPRERAGARGSVDRGDRGRRNL